MSQDIRGRLLLDDESAPEVNESSWEDDGAFGLTETDFQLMKSTGWTAEDLTIDENQLAEDNRITFWSRFAKKR